MSLASAFAPAEARYVAKVIGVTWGHLAAKKNKTYRGHITFAIPAYGGQIAFVEADFEGLDDSPWLYAAMQDFVFSLDKGAGVFRFEGMFRNYEFTGTVRQLELK